MPQSPPDPQYPDCSRRVCPSAPAWSDVPRADGTAHYPAECSNMGQCDRIEGVCICYPGFRGKACEKTICPEECSGHGQCQNLNHIARLSYAEPLTRNLTSYGDTLDGSVASRKAWDARRIACLRRGGRLGSKGAA